MPGARSITCGLVGATADGVDCAVRADVELVLKRIDSVTVDEIRTDPKTDDRIFRAEIDRVLLRYCVAYCRRVVDGSGDIIAFSAGNDRGKEADNACQQ